VGAATTTMMRSMERRRRAPGLGELRRKLVTDGNLVLARYQR